MTTNLNTMLIRLQPRPMIAVSDPETALQAKRERKTVASARNVAKAFWQAEGSSYSYLLTRPDDNVKLHKSAIPTYGLSLAPASLSGLNTCPWSTRLCRRGCLNTAGKGELDRVQRGRAIKTRFLAAHPAEALTILVAELRAAVAKHGNVLMRLNVLSDLDWHAICPQLFDIPGVTFYDYTKSLERFERYLAGWLPENYRLVYSASERVTDDVVDDLLLAGGTVAMVFDQKPPAQYRAMAVINGDASDDRVNDPKGVIVGLKAKGRMRAAEYVEGGFVRKVEG